MAGNPQQKPGTQLAVANVIDIKDEIERDLGTTSGTAQDEKVEQWVERLINLNPDDIRDKEKGRGAIETLGLDLQRMSAKQSMLLKKPIAMLSKRADDKGDVGNALVDLKVQVEALDPGKFDFEPGWFGRAVGKLPGVGTPLKRYFSKYQSVQTVIDAILKSLERGRDELSRDIVTLAEDQKRMRDLTVKLTGTIEMAQKLDEKLEARISSGADLPEEKRNFLQEELLFPLRQRTMDMQQQLAVNQQGVLASELIIRNNRELVRGVNRALNVTAAALQVAATVALALESQKRVLEKIETTGRATSDLIAGTAARLKTQGAQIQKQAAGTTLDLEKLKSAFADLNTAMDDISRFRREALPTMAQSVLDLDKLTKEGEASIKRMEAAKAQREGVLISVDKE